MTDRRVVSHLLRRLTFGPTAGEVDAAVRAGYDATSASLLRPAAAVAAPELGADPSVRLGRDATREQKQQARREQREQAATAVRWWLARMVGGGGAAEKMTFFWHGHWATSVRKVRSAQLMLAQQATFRRYGAGDTGPLVRAMLRDPALILWLDGQKNTRKAPNENLAREVMELFTLGVGAYAEADVKAAARVLTGWQVDRAAGAARLVPRRHDDRPVTLLGRTATFDVDSYADALVRHEAHVPFVAGRLWARYAGGTAPPAAVVAAGRNTTALVEAMCRAPEFAGTAGTLVKQPVEWLVGAIRQLKVPFADLAAAEQQRLVGVLRALGQVPFAPPSVGGWPAGTAWLTTSSTLTRLKAGQQLAGLAPAVTDGLTGDDRLDALAVLLVVDGWTDRTRAALRDVRDPRRLLALGLASPEYAVH